MISLFRRVAASRVAVRALRLPTTSRGAGCVVVQHCPASSQPQPVLAHVVPRYFSTAPPVFLDATEVADRIMEVIKKFDQVDKDKVTPETKFAEDLGLDSLDIVEVVMAIEDEFAIEIPDTEADKITTVKEAIDYICGHPMAK